MMPFTMLCSPLVDFRVLHDDSMASQLFDRGGTEFLHILAYRCSGIEYLLHILTMT